MFHSMDEIRAFGLPNTANLIEIENKMQCPNAKFIVGGIMSMSEDGDTKDLVVFFDAGNGEENTLRKFRGDDTTPLVLWVWAPLGDEEDLDDSFIDEYYEISFEQAKQYCGEIFSQRKV